MDKESFFDEMNYGFLEVEFKNMQTFAKYEKGELNILTADEISDYEFQTGISGYMIEKNEHPEELLATVFSLMVYGIFDNLRSQERLRHYLAD